MKNRNTHPDLPPRHSDAFTLEHWGKVGGYFCTHGEADITINGREQHLTPGTFFMVTPLIQINGLSPSPDFRYLSLLEEQKTFLPILHTLKDIRIPIRISQHPLWTLSADEQAFFVRQTERLALKTEQLASLPPGEQALLLHHMRLIRQETIFEIVFRRIKQLPAETEKPLEKATGILYNFILSLYYHHYRQRSVAFYAKEACLSTSHFTHIIKSCTGKPPSDWIAHFTINQAKNLLDKPDLLIKEIAEELNFPEQFTFRKYFMRYTHLSPKAYRQQRLLQTAAAPPAPSAATDRACRPHNGASEE